MPTYRNSSKLQNDEWILLQVKEGPCSAGCDYCYENVPTRKLLNDAKRNGNTSIPDPDSLNTIELARLMPKLQDSVPVEMSLTEMAGIFEAALGAGIDRIGLIGSEPTTHTQFREILELADRVGIELLVYTAGFNLRVLEHHAVKYVVLHLDYGRMSEAERVRRIYDGRLPPDNYMAGVLRLLENGTQVHLRVNFTQEFDLEKTLINNFFSKVPPHLHRLLMLKYSFSTRVAETSGDFDNPESLRNNSKLLCSFVDGMNASFPGVELLSERPLFPCSFDDETWEKYSVSGGFVSSCDMEFTFYAEQGLALCPPSRDLVKTQQISSSEDLVNRVGELRSFLEDVYRVPSFEQCISCSARKDLSCQGGCLGYKVGQAASESEGNQVA